MKVLAMDFELAQVPAWSEGKVERRAIEDLLRQGGAPGEIEQALIGLAFHEPDLDGSYETILMATHSPNVSVRGTAVLCLGHLARIHRRFPDGRALAVVRAALVHPDEHVRGQAHAAASDLMRFVPAYKDCDLGLMSRLAELRHGGVVCDELAMPATSQLILVARRLAAGDATHKFDATDATRHEVVAWLSGLPVSQDQPVAVIWPAEGRGLCLRYADMSENFDRLWYPAADDVWIVDPGAPSWLLELHHEEVFTWRTNGAR